MGNARAAEGRMTPPGSNVAAAGLVADRVPRDRSAVHRSSPGRHATPQRRTSNDLMKVYDQIFGLAGRGAATRWASGRSIRMGSGSHCRPRPVQDVRDTLWLEDCVWTAREEPTMLEDLYRD